MAARGSHWSDPKIGCLLEMKETAGKKPLHDLSHTCAILLCDELSRTDNQVSKSNLSVGQTETGDNKNASSWLEATRKRASAVGGSSHTLYAHKEGSN